MEFAATDHTMREEVVAQRSSYLPVAVAVSVLLHLLLATFFMQSKISTPLAEKPELVSINLTSLNPNKVVPPSPSTVLEEIEVAQEVVEQAPELSNLPEQILPNAQLQAESFGEVELAEQDDTENSISETNVSVGYPAPTFEAISQSVQEVSRSRETQFYSYVCNPLEQEEGLKECAPKPSGLYERIEVNAVYQAFNPAREVSRSEIASGVISSQMKGVSSRLRGELNGGLSGYLIEELEAGISHNANAGNRAVQHMIDMTDRSEAAAQARQVLGNPLLIDLKRAQQNPTRGVLLAPP